MKTKHSTAAGVIVVNSKNGKVLLLYKKRFGHWEYSKGGIEKGESEVTTARRELKEEIGTKNIKIDRTFKEIINYSFRAEGINIKRTVTFFLGFTQDKIKLSGEHTKYKWCSFNEANKIFNHHNYKMLLKKVEQHLMKKK
ncbi:NUDIX domain-containing protein [Patescibacteria group bacterium]|nr:NUDIX domain-containing protein [Patescibacteria group bacterium]MBU1889886.1 NUDIX domain-containing protein [Patescibacteria group bacterium]